MRRSLAVLMAACAPLLGLTACGGDNVSEGGAPAAAILPAAPTPAPAPAPAPASSPPPTPIAYTPNSLPSAANATVGLQQLTDFATFSYHMSFPQTGGSFAIGFETARTSTTITIPGFPSGYLDLLASQSSTDYTSSVLLPSGGATFHILRPNAQNSVLALAHASVGWWSNSRLVAIPAFETTGVFAYGVPAAAGGFPTDGTARYRVLGFAVFDSITEGYLIGRFGGEVDIDFAARTVTGRIAAGDRPGIDPGTNPPTLVFSASNLSGDGRFSGQARATDGTAGTYEGRLTGPQGQEIILRWSGRFAWQIGGNLTSTHNGAMAGKR